MCNCIDAKEVMNDVIIHAQEVIKKHPSLKEEIDGLIDLCQCEIEQGESSEHEIGLCWSDIDILVEELKENN